jgi:hypothetical protein
MVACNSAGIQHKGNNSELRTMRSVAIVFVTELE